MAERWLSVDQIAVHLGGNLDTIYKIARKSRPAHKIGMLWKFLASEVDQWIKRGLAAQELAGAATPKNQQGKSWKSFTS